MADKIMLTYGLEAEFDDDIGAYTTTVQYNCFDVEITLAECEENPDTIDRLKDAFDKFYGGMEKFDSLAREALCKKVLPMLDQHPAGSVQMDDFQSNYVLKAADILDSDSDVVRVELTYADKDSDPDDYDSTVLCAAGTLENGFEEFYRNGTLIIPKD